MGMLVKLKRPSTVGHIVKIDNGDADLSAGLDVTVMGWGSIDECDTKTDVLLEVEVDIIPNDICNTAYEDSDGVTENMICAAREGKDSCRGDSGGPLIIKGASSYEEDIQVGIVSWGRGCAQPGFPGVYVRVSAFYDFIMFTMD